MSGVHIEGSDPIIALIGLGFGIYFFFAGFKELKLKRIIQNILTSKINTGAVGTNFEVAGRIVSEKDQIVQAPISGKGVTQRPRHLVHSKNLGRPHFKHRVRGLPVCHLSPIT
jgi:hypothetical protein